MNTPEPFELNHTLQVELGDRSYPIYIGKHLLAHAGFFQPHIHGNQVYVITNEIVAPLYLDRVTQCLGQYAVETIILPDGESTKNLDTINSIYTRLLELRANRTATLIALGGGVIGDITGFVAATYQRGINFIQVPTTLLSQVDSSVGGKTGVNHQLGKNMIGAFYQPQAVIADTASLNTVDNRQLSAGLAEVIKYGLIRDKKFALWLNQAIPQVINRNPDSLAETILRSCKNKAEVVAADEMEKGQRALLNFGHTFGHAIETALGYGTWLHGEAVAAGMFMAALLSMKLGWLDPQALDFVEQQLVAAKLPIRPPDTISKQQFLEIMAVDKKVVNKKLRLVLLKSIGQAVVSDDFDNSQLYELLDTIQTVAVNSVHA